jgi:hypothetical protein
MRSTAHGEREEVMLTWRRLQPDEKDPSRRAGRRERGGPRVRYAGGLGHHIRTPSPRGSMSQLNRNRPTVAMQIGRDAAPLNAPRRLLGVRSLGLRDGLPVGPLQEPSSEVSEPEGAVGSRDGMRSGHRGGQRRRLAVMCSRLLHGRWA